MGNDPSRFKPLQIRRLGGGTGNCLPVCNFECDNLTWIRNTVLVSIMLKIWETIEKKLKYYASGPKVF